MSGKRLIADPDVAMMDEAIKAAYENTEKIMKEFGVDDCPYDLQHNLPSSMTGMLDVLIQETGRFVESYASDLLVSVNCMMEKLRSASGNKAGLYLFGLRKSGVDHYEYVRSNMLQNRGCPHRIDDYYRKIYAIKAEILPREDSGAADTLRLEMKEIGSQLAHELYMAVSAAGRKEA